MLTITSEKKSLFRSYANEFEKNYLLEPKGQKHLEGYKIEKDDVEKYWLEIKKSKKAGKRITDLVLEKLLPYSNTRHNREKKYRISVAPAITRDLRKWFENVGWQDSKNWENVANALFELFYTIIEKNNVDILAKFENNQSISKGIKAGFLSPTLHCLNPKYRIINNKTIETLKFLYDKNVIGRELSNYIENIEIIDKTIEKLSIAIFQDPDVFDSFCHWMCDKRLGGYARIEQPDTDLVFEEEGLTSFEEELEPQNHWEAISYVLKIGNLLGFKTYVADPSRKAFGKKLGEIATLKDVPQILKSAPEISRVDAIWYKPKPPFFFFEIEDGGTMREALHRLYNTMAFDARFFIICPIHNRSKFDKWVTTAPFKEFEERYLFRTYSDLFNFYKEVLDFTSMRERFLKL